MEGCGVDPQLRPETLSPAQFGRLAARYAHHQEETRRQSA
jgi:hypothetical protein